MRSEPAFPGTNRTSLPCPAENPWSRRPVAACSNAGGTGPVGIVAPTGMISTECGRFGSSLLKWSATVQPCGTVSTRPPRLNPLKFIPPLSSVRPATSLKSTVLLAASVRSHVGSILPPPAVWAAAAPTPQSSTVKQVSRRIWTVSLSGRRLVQQPRQDVQRVVVARPAPGPIVIARAAVELIVRHVLELQPQVLPRHDVDLGNQAVSFRAGGTVPRVEQGVARAGRDERGQGERVARADVIHGVHAERAQGVRGIRRAPGGPGLLLVNPGPVEREAVRPERVHVREVHRQIGEPIGRPRDAGRIDARREAVGPNGAVVLAPH